MRCKYQRIWTVGEEKSTYTWVHRSLTLKCAFLKRCCLRYYYNSCNTEYQWRRWLGGFLQNRRISLFTHQFCKRNIIVSIISFVFVCILEKKKCHRKEFNDIMFRVIHVNDNHRWEKILIVLYFLLAGEMYFLLKFSYL